MKNFRSQLILLLSASIILGILSSVFTAHYFLKKDSINQLNHQIHNLEVLILNSFKEQENYFNFELSNQDYFISHQSKYLNQYQTISHDIFILFGKLEGEHDLLNQNALSQLQKIKRAIQEYDSIFKEIVSKVQQRGYKDYGLEGKMRENAHQLERVAALKLSDVLTLRRHEKDFILRQDSSYIDKFLEKQLEMETQLINSNFSKNKKDSVRQILENYQRQFLFLTELEQQIGLKTNQGLKNLLNQTTIQLTKKLNEFEQDLSVHQQKILFRQTLLQLILWSIYLMVIIVLILHFSKKFTTPLHDLSKRINYFVNTNFTARLKESVYEKNDELGLLWKNFLKMEEMMVEYIELFKEKVDEKTYKLIAKNREIEYQNKNLKDAMKYGWRLQRSMLPGPEKLKKQLGHAFIFFQPKDIVSGDIYWLHKNIKKGEVEHILAVVDCTGHGVPGAFMSVLAINALNDAVLRKKHSQAHHIVQSVNNYVYQSMKYHLNNNEENHSKEGMDLIVCKFNQEKKSLEYCGANRPLYLVREFEDENKIKPLEGNLSNSYKQKKSDSRVLFEIKASKKTVGTLNNEQSVTFKNNRLILENDDMIYLTSDGYADQFGGPKSKKLMNKKLKKLFLKIHSLSALEQENSIKTTFLNWKDAEDQIDDVTILGFKV